MRLAALARNRSTGAGTRPRCCATVGGSSGSSRWVPWSVPPARASSRLATKYKRRSGSRRVRRAAAPVGGRSVPINCSSHTPGRICSSPTWCWTKSRATCACISHRIVAGRARSPGSQWLTPIVPVGTGSWWTTLAARSASLGRAVENCRAVTSATPLAAHWACGGRPTRACCRKAARLRSGSVPCETRQRVWAVHSRSRWIRAATFSGLG